MRTFNELAIGERWSLYGQHFVKIGRDESIETDQDGWIAHDGKGVPNFGAVDLIDLQWNSPNIGVGDNKPTLGVSPAGWEFVHKGGTSDITHWRPHQAEKAAPADTTNPDMREEIVATNIISAAFDVLKTSMQADESYAWSWHCNLITHSSGESHEHANRHAAILMQHIWGIDVTQFDVWKHFEREWEAEKAAPAATTPNPDMRPDSDRERAYRLKQEAAKEQAKLQREKEAAARKSEGDGLTTVAPTPRFGWLGGLR